MHPTAGPLAMQPQPVYAAVAEAPRRANFAQAVQVPLFLPPDRPAPNVIPFESYAPETRPIPPKPRLRTPSTTPRAARKTGRGVVEEQGSLEFLPTAPPKPKTLPTTVEARIYCDAPVATRVHRLLAAAVDWSMVLIAYSLFLGIFFKMGGVIVPNKADIFTFAGMLGVVGGTYGWMWSWAGGETFGMRFTRLRLLTFEGFPPDRRQRLLRLAGSCLSLGTLLGVAWSLVDEEGLGWQDHISGTFPTPRTLDEQVLRRR